MVARVIRSLPAVSCARPHVICPLVTPIQSILCRLRLSEIACTWRLLETRGDLGTQPDDAGGIPCNSCRALGQPAKLRVPACGEIRTGKVGMALVPHL